MSGAGETGNPVFIVGMNGSGTTMLLDCLNNHPDLYGFKRETKIIPHFIRSAEKYGDLSSDDNFRRMWNDFLNVSFFKYVNNGNKVPLPENWKDAPRSVAGVINGTFVYFSEQEGKSRWCEKTPMYAQHISLLAKTFPEAKFIHIIRDGRACAASFHRRWGYTPELTVFRWKHVVQDARTQGSEIPDRYFELNYEDLTDDPEPWLQSICRFLQVPYDPCLVTLSRVRKHSGSSNTMITKKVEYWPDYFTAEKIDSFDRMAGKLIQHLGYKTKHPEGNEEPGALRIKFWMYRDNIRHLTRILGKEVINCKHGGKWDDLSGRIFNSIKQKLMDRI